MSRAAVSTMQFYRITPGDVSEPDVRCDEADPAWAIVSLGQALLKHFHDQSKPEVRRSYRARLVGRDGITLVEIMIDKNGKVEHVLTPQMRRGAPGGATAAV